MRQSKIWIVASYTFKELMKSKILWNVGLIGLILMLVTFLATEFTFGVPERIALDFGIGMLSISALAISLFLGVSLLSKEIDSRTVYMIISRPVPRHAFIIGKIVGLMSVQFVNVLVLSGMTIAITYLLGGKINALILWTFFFIFIESFMLLLVVVLLSLIANNVVSVLVALSLLLMGHAVHETKDLMFVHTHAIFKYALNAYQFVLPAFYKLNLKDYVIYNSTLPYEYLLSNLAYGVSYSLALLFLIIVVFNRKNID